MTKENEENLSNNKNVRCEWCGLVDERKKFYASPGDDLENPEPFHEECLKALKYFTILASMETNKNEEQMIKLANRLAGVEIKTRKNKK